MTSAIDPVALASRLIACPSVTPKEAGALTILGEALQDIGFEVHRFLSGQGPDGPVENLFASRGQGGPHFAFAGHIDVVPAGNGWTSDAFEPEIRDGLLYGRGAADMKGAIAAFVAAAVDVREHEGTLSFIITGDEEGPAVHGTRAIMEWMAERSIRPDMILIGEPTSQHRLGDMVKIGRRGSVNIWIDVVGTQGHVAYPHLADNPIARLARILSALQAMELDEGTLWFQPSNLEVTDLRVDNPACNVIPGEAHARLNIRFNDLQKGPELVARVTCIVEEFAPGARIEARISGEAFLNEPGPLSEMVAAAIREETGLTAKLSTSGGTSDARFLTILCPVIEFGLPNATMHKLDEAVAVEDLHALRAIYARIIRSALG